MLLVSWNHSRFQVLTRLPKGVKFKAGYFPPEGLERIKISRRGIELAALEN
jgi:hypothetical protein